MSNPLKGLLALIFLASRVSFRLKLRHACRRELMHYANVPC